MSEPAVSAPLSRGELGQLARVHVGVLAFYVIDALLLASYGRLGSVSPDIGWQYGLAGLVVAGAQIALFRRGRRDRRALDANNVSMSLTACALMLLTALRAPAVGGLMLMSMMTVFAATALQLARSPLLFVYLAFAGGAAWAMANAAASLQWPMRTPAERAVTAVWFAWLLAKCAAVNIAGTQLRQLVRQANAKLAAALAEVERAASTDELTVLPNRRRILCDLDVALDRTAERLGCVGVALFDIDHFKSVNDRYGHAAGDAVLREFGKLVSGSLRPSDTVGRYGGEEFLLVLQQVRDPAAACEATDRLRTVVERHDWGRVAEGLAVTASAGVAVIAPDEDRSEAIRRADAALYAAKAAGRNRVVIG